MKKIVLLLFVIVVTTNTTLAQGTEMISSEPTIEKMCDFVFERIPASQDFVTIKVGGKEYKAVKRTSTQVGYEGKMIFAFYEIDRMISDAHDHVSATKDPGGRWKSLDSGDIEYLKVAYAALGGNDPE